MQGAFPEQRKLKVAFVFNHPFFLGGGEISFSELIRTLNKSSFEPVILLPSSGEIAAFFEKQKVEVLVTPFPPLKQVLDRPLPSLRRLLAALKQTKPDIIHANGSRACFYSVLAGRLLGIPVLWHVRETLQDLFFYDAFLGLASKSIVCVSKSVGTKRFRRFGPLFKKKIAVVYNGVDTSRFVRDEQARDHMRKRLSIQDSNVLFGMLGNIIHRKGYEFFLQSLAEAKKLDNQLPAKALIVGRRLDTEYYAMLMRLISDLHLQGSVLFEEYSESVQPILSAMDVFVLSSRSEGFSRALLEAMSSGLPVLASRISEIEEAVADQENALLIDFGDVQSMASAIVTLSKDDALRKRMAERNRERAVEKFDLKAHAGAVEHLYRRLTFRKQTTTKATILIDAREFAAERRTGIARVLEGLVDALTQSALVDCVILAVTSPEFIPGQLCNRDKVKPEILNCSFLISEHRLSVLSGLKANLFISPYPKLPLFGCRCKAVHVIHDVLDLTHPAYRKRAKAHFDTWRLRRSLERADLTWYDSQWSLDQTRDYAGLVGKNPRVRYPGLDERFVPDRDEKDQSVWKKYGLNQGYILALGNGLPHKNLGVLLEIADQLPRQLVLAGVSKGNQIYWEARYPASVAAWIHYLPDEDLPSLLRGAFCLVQPSTAEGYGYPPMEAMACGIPAVVSDIPVLKETTGGNAIPAEADKPEKWLETFRALENEEFYRGQVERGLRWVESLRGRKAWLSYVSDIEELLNKN